MCNIIDIIIIRSHVKCKLFVTFTTENTSEYSLSFSINIILHLSESKKCIYQITTQKCKQGILILIFYVMWYLQMQTVDQFTSWTQNDHDREVQQTFHNILLYILNTV